MAWRDWVKSAIAAGLVGGALAGCNSNKENPAVEVKPTDLQTPAASIGGGPEPGPLSVTPEAKAERMNQPFAEACTLEVNADAGVALPPTFTLTKQNTGQLNEEVQRIWNGIKFTTTDGKQQSYLIELDVVQGGSELGRIEILMPPEIAPNHVRNFVALTMLKYYDGLRIDRIVQQQGDGDMGPSRLALLEAGSPVENADPAASHLGYWLRPEFSDAVKHEEGTVGACLLESEDNAETAACRFYINLTAAPAMDGNFTAFGKVTRGIEVARKLVEQPVRDPNGGPDQGRPVTPIVIRKATVRAVPVVE